MGACCVKVGKATLPFRVAVVGAGFCVGDGVAALPAVAPLCTELPELALAGAGFPPAAAEGVVPMPGIPGATPASGETGAVLVCPEPSTACASRMGDGARDPAWAGAAEQNAAKLIRTAAG